MTGPTDATGARDLVYDPSKPWRLSAEALDLFYGSKTMTRLYENTGMVGRIDGFQLGAGNAEHLRPYHLPFVLAASQPR